MRISDETKFHSFASLGEFVMDFGYRTAVLGAVLFIFSWGCLAADLSFSGACQIAVSRARTAGEIEDTTNGVQSLEILAEAQRLMKERGLTLDQLVDSVIGLVVDNKILNPTVAHDAAVFLSGLEREVSFEKWKSIVDLYFSLLKDGNWLPEEFLSFVVEQLDRMLLTSKSKKAQYLAGKAVQVTDLMTKEMYGSIQSLAPKIAYALFYVRSDDQYDALYRLRTQLRIYRETKVADRLTSIAADQGNISRAAKLGRAIEHALDVIDMGFQARTRFEYPAMSARNPHRSFYARFQELHIRALGTEAAHYSPFENIILVENRLSERDQNSDAILEAEETLRAYYAERIRLAKDLYWLFRMSPDADDAWTAFGLFHSIYTDLDSNLRTLKQVSRRVKSHPKEQWKAAFVDHLIDTLQLGLGGRLSEIHLYVAPGEGFEAFKKRWEVIRSMQQKGYEVDELELKDLKSIGLKANHDFASHLEKRLQSLPALYGRIPEHVLENFAEALQRVTGEYAASEEDQVNAANELLQFTEKMEAAIKGMITEYEVQQNTPNTRLVLAKRLLHLHFETIGMLRLIKGVEAEVDSLTVESDDRTELIVKESLQKLSGKLGDLRDATKLYLLFASINTTHDFAVRASYIENLARQGFQLNDLPEEFLEAVGSMTDAERFSNRLNGMTRGPQPSAFKGFKHFSSF